MSSLVYGIHAVDGLVNTNQAKELFILKKQNSNPKIDKLVANAQTSNIEVSFVENIKELPFRVKKGVTHQGVFAIEKIDFQTYSENDIEELLPTHKEAFILVLDNVQDPHNFGACIRSAHSAGVDFIVVSKDNSSPINATVKKVACGAAEHTKIVVATNLARAIEKLKKAGVWIIGLAGEADESLYSMNLKDSVAIVAGAEGSGMRARTKSTCDFLAKLPMLGEVSSLNVSVAAGIAMYEGVRQRVS
ncbi:23S rRNA (guanosine(2251)-2'-O)-methyltransferase RlmB [Francisella adeliensis]|uniref:23S rRNA (Guanosine(2251)-2'-O)-methyltransferase RlmB n=1 Tax=Francisella adeliensis TaxID=2007306 RepID=A0A2Z4Y099_9GAMM|nr:23S rRNA (guanosine(2251)-2'-O)-methyltransferase RlmB [Francisella adeliensis]AXA34055.1 23S rRNA (guanosine(2251)-2'-O)-methyltransferase RlmB [Francisella adeliensis]MBK2085218.1 23S rRNA (guanosine(2251)-2'-O)-methyltransferase RlmB [Francisella adeliensis]MBK2096014.1 23S rRNA (guanosine(2251)-2'-O)-methyltransferase RlmB [Francisella adeliensis]QIW12294.1 23S rRNA (guanosine(2251)-2'-O)-methyltransferase RlmB [Francisella adeliensis]QIW14168.1 23S rRNA (guanosine(2251)-2'-O)-methyltra